MPASSASKGEAPSGTGTGSPKAPIVRAVGPIWATSSSNARTPAASGVNGSPVARARPQGCTVRSSSTMAPTVRAGRFIAPVTPASAPGTIHASISDAVSFSTYARHPSPYSARRSGVTEKSADRIRRDRSILRVEDFARAEGLSVRSLQRLFAAYVGVGPKWVFLRYRVHERAHSHPCVDWSALAAEPGYSDQAHLVRDFTATVGIPPTTYEG